jgi:hypothetical protein
MDKSPHEPDRDDPSTHRKRIAFSVTKSGKKAHNPYVTSPLLRTKVEPT